MHCPHLCHIFREDPAADNVHKPSSFTNVVYLTVNIFFKEAPSLKPHIGIEDASTLITTHIRRDLICEVLIGEVEETVANWSKRDFPLQLRIFYHTRLAHDLAGTIVSL